MLWKVENSNLHVLGSVHMMDSAIKFRAAERKAIRQAVAVAFETDFRLPLQPGTGEYADADAAGARGELGPELFKKVSALGAQYGIAEETLLRMRPWMLRFVLPSALANSIGLQAAHSVDRAVMAEGASRKFVFLETITESLAPFANAPSSEHRTALEALTASTEDTFEDLHAIAQAWRDRDPSAMHPVYRRGDRNTPWSFNAAIRGRNAAWLPQLLTLARATQPSLAVVGALHMIGSGSLIELFAREGLSCTPVTT